MVPAGDGPARRPQARLRAYRRADPVHHAGVCGTDLHIWEWDSWASNRLKPPVVVGHEFAGEIVELGREAPSASCSPWATW